MISKQEQLAEQRTREVLLAQPAVSQLVIDSPPGAGKTGIVERLAIQGAWVTGERVMIAGQTNGQGFDLAFRIASGWPDKPVYLFVRRGLPIPAKLDPLENLNIITDISRIKPGPSIVISNASKWSYVDPEKFNADLLVVDEAYQLKDSQFAQIAGLAERQVLVGDPGQIAPVISSDVSRWRDMPDGPHIPAPSALLARRPTSTLRMTLPVTRRLPADTTSYIQPAFYPDLPFESTSAEHERGLSVDAGSGDCWDEVIDKASEGASILMAELPGKISGEFDDALSQQIVSLIERLLQRNALLEDDGTQIKLTADQIGVVCAHRSQVYCVQEKLSASLSDVHVETAERFQGLERRVIIVHHPLSGRLSLSDFQLDSGRLCVMTSRHRVACFIVARAGLAERLQLAAPSLERVLGASHESIHGGRSAHRRFLQQLVDSERIISVQP
jgi:hypothetical protein